MFCKAKIRTKPMIGLEPITCWLQISCSANWATSAHPYYFQMTPAGIEPALPPWKGDVLTAWPWSRCDFVSQNRNSRTIFLLDCETHSDFFRYLSLFGSFSPYVGGWELIAFGNSNKMFHFYSVPMFCFAKIGTTPRVGLEPTTPRLTAECSTIELSRKILLNKKKVIIPSKPNTEMNHLTSERHPLG